MSVNNALSVIDNSDLTADDQNSIITILDKFKDATYATQLETVKIITQQSAKVKRALFTVLDVAKDYQTDNKILTRIVEEYKRKNGPLDTKFIDSIKRDIKSLEEDSLMDDELYNKIQQKNKEVKAIKSKLTKHN